MVGGQCFQQIVYEARTVYYVLMASAGILRCRRQPASKLVLAGSKVAYIQHRSTPSAFLRLLYSLTMVVYSSVHLGERCKTLLSRLSVSHKRSAASSPLFTRCSTVCLSIRSPTTGEYIPIWIGSKLVLAASFVWWLLCLPRLGVRYPEHILANRRSPGVCQNLFRLCAYDVRE